MTTLTATQPHIITEKARISSIDIMRGIVMVIMALDHIRDFFHYGAMASDPTSMATTTPAIFFTRWVTHFCAPTFVLLAGTSISLNARRKPKKELSIFLLTRGLWLILLEVVVVRFGLFFNFYYDVIVFQVIWAIGASMVCMAGLIHLSYRTLLIVGLFVVFGHNIHDVFALKPEGALAPVWGILMQPGFFSINLNTALWVHYPLLGWLGIMICGYCLGKLYTDFDSEKRQKLLLKIGLTTVALFITLRLINLYGDPAPWSVQQNGIFTFMSFLNTTKYPVSLLYTLMTIGPVLIILSLMERIDLRVFPMGIRWANLFTVFGRVPLFYYILHFYLLHAAALFLYMNKSGKSLSEIDFHFSQSLGGIPPDGGYALRWAYVAWIILVILLYPLCKWYNQYKSTHKHWWLSYL